MKVFLLFFCISIFNKESVFAEKDYTIYHQHVIKAEEHIGNHNFQEALSIYESLFEKYEFVFLKEYRMATQLAWHLGQSDKAFEYLRKAILGGWEKGEIKKNKFLAPLREEEEWREIKKEYAQLRTQFLDGLNLELRDEMNKMYKQDQWKAFQALFTFSSRRQDRFAERRYAPDSKKRIQRVDEIIEQYAYPGEKLIGESFWLWGMMTHYNSVSQEYNSKDTLYPSIRPKLLKAIQSGEMSPYDFAFIEEWYIGVKSGWEEKSFGYINEINKDDLVSTNQRRFEIGIRSIEIRNRLVKIQEETGMNFYLQGGPWQDGKILF